MCLVGRSLRFLLAPTAGRRLSSIPLATPVGLSPAVPPRPRGFASLFERPAMPHRRHHRDDDYYDPPPPRPRKHKKASGPSTALIVGLALGGVLLLTGA